MKNYTPRLLKKYHSESLEQLKKKLNISNVMRLPKLTKIVLNMGIGDARDDKNSFKQALEELSTITGQRAIGTKSKKAISNFKIRQGDPVGTSVTLRKTIMYEFLDRFISIAAPRIRDFRGFPSKGFDGRGNYNFGLTEQIVFPEINYDKVNSIRGMNITIVTSAYTDLEAYELLVSLGFPINEYIDNKKQKKSSIKKNENKTEEKVQEVKPNGEKNEQNIAEDSEVKEENNTENADKEDSDGELNNG